MVERSDPRGRAARRLREGSERLADIFQHELTTWPAEGIWKSPMLGGMVLSFLRLLGEELAKDEPDPDVPWTRNQGLLRLAPGRGAPALAAELAVLERMVRVAVQPLAAEPVDPAVLDLCSRALERARVGAFGELAALYGRPRGDAPRFGGIVVELFEPPPSVIGRHAADPAPI